MQAYLAVLVDIPSELLFCRLVPLSNYRSHATVVYMIVNSLYFRPFFTSVKKNA